MWKILIVMLLVCVPCFAEVKQDPQKFKVTYEVTYNTTTLADAAKKELEIKAANKDAYSVNVSIKDTTNSTLYFTTDNVVRSW